VRTACTAHHDNFLKANKLLAPHASLASLHAKHYTHHPYQTERKLDGIPPGLLHLAVVARSNGPWLNSCREGKVKATRWNILLAALEYGPLTEDNYSSFTPSQQDLQIHGLQTTHAAPFGLQLI